MVDWKLITVLFLHIEFAKEALNDPRVHKFARLKKKGKCSAPKCIVNAVLEDIGGNLVIHFCCFEGSSFFYKNFNSLLVIFSNIIC